MQTRTSRVASAELDLLLAKNPRRPRASPTTAAVPSQSLSPSTFTNQPSTRVTSRSVRVRRVLRARFSTLNPFGFPRGLPQPRFWIASGLPATRKLARPVNTSAFIGSNLPTRRHYFRLARDPPGVTPDDPTSQCHFL